MAEEQASDAVCVAVHIRPLVQSELVEGCQTCLEVTPGQPQARLSISADACTAGEVAAAWPHKHVAIITELLDEGKVFCGHGPLLAVPTCTLHINKMLVVWQCHTVPKIIPSRLPRSSR